MAYRRRSLPADDALTASDVVNAGFGRPAHGAPRDTDVHELQVISGVAKAADAKGSYSLQNGHTHAGADAEGGGDEDEPVALCRVCGNTAAFMCSRCGPGVQYCSAQCQTDDWPTHKTECAGTVRPQAPPRVGSMPEAGESDRSIPPISRGESTDTLQSGEMTPGTLTGTRGRRRRRGRNAAAATINQDTHFSDRVRNLFRRRGQSVSLTPAPGAQVPTQIVETEPPLTEEEKAEDLKYYMEQIFLIIKPVICCIILAILWVKLTSSVDEYYDSSTGASSGGSTGVGSVVGGSTDNSGGAVTQSFVTAFIILGEIIGSTIVIVILFYFGFMKILFGFFILVVLGLLGLFGYTLGVALLNAHNLALDQFSFWFFVWNLAVVGVASIFYKGPMLLQQIYLVLMSSKMAFTLTQLPAVTTWILLALLAVWDLIAVLCPFGPLRILVETSRTQNREIPALLYTAMVWIMASPGTPPSSTSVLRNTDPAAVPNSVTVPQAAYLGQERVITVPTTPVESSTSRLSDCSDYGDERALTDTMRRWQVRSGEGADGEGADGEGRREEGAEGRAVGESGGTVERGTGQEGGAEEGEDEEEEERGLKLGLGDFVFYSVLVARAALFDWITTVSCTVAVMTGLNMTIFLLAIYQKALPALPISIAFGILFYFVTAMTLSPFVNIGLLHRPDRIPITTLQTGLWVGKGGGGGMIHV
ncbi:hypothetical protein HDV00_001065 [Rhizophlyctis rosea]|nr:hypothetical protein HDV00_001065 [Rhizophlyctis rosea]